MREPASGAVRSSGSGEVEAREPGRFFVNVSNHPVETWTEKQRLAALEISGAEKVVDYHFPQVPPEAGPEEVEDLARKVVQELRGRWPDLTHCMVQGEHTLTYRLVRELRGLGIRCFTATTVRQVMEVGPTEKVSRFTFVRFREYR